MEVTSVGDTEDCMRICTSTVFQWEAETTKTLQGTPYKIQEDHLIEWKKHVCMNQHIIMSEVLSFREHNMRNMKTRNNCSKRYGRKCKINPDEIETVSVSTSVGHGYSAYTSSFGHIPQQMMKRECHHYLCQVGQRSINSNSLADQKSLTPRQNAGARKRLKLVIDI